MKKLDKQIMLSLIDEHRNLVTKKEKSAFFTRAARENLMPVKSFKERFYRFRDGLFTKVGRKPRADKGGSRLPVDHNDFINDVFTISSICVSSSLNQNNQFNFFKNKKFIPLNLAIKIAYSMGKIKHEYALQTVRRRMKELGLNYITFFRDLAALKLKASHSNHVWLIDATMIQSIYLNRSGNLIYDPSLATDKNHAEDRIRQRDLRKVWLYFIVDKYSKLFIVRIYAGEKLGENPEHWVETLKFAMQQKEDYRNPFKGIPVNIYADGGALKGKLMTKICDYFDILKVPHAPGRSRATGAVESRIGQFKKTIETLFNAAIKKSELHNSKLDSLINFANEWSHHINETNGLYREFVSGLPGKPQEVTDEDFLKASFDTETRTSDEYGIINVDGEDLFVSRDCAAMKVEIIRRYPDLVYARDVNGIEHLCSRDLSARESILFEKKAKQEKGRFEDNQDEVVKRAIDFKKNTTAEELLPSKIFRLPNNDKYTVTSCWEKLLEETNFAEDEIHPEIKELCLNYFKTALEQNNRVTPEVMNKVVNLFKEYIKEQNQKEANNQ